VRKLNNRDTGAADHRWRLSACATTLLSGCSTEKIVRASMLPFLTTVYAAVGPVENNPVDSPCDVQNGQAEQHILQLQGAQRAAAMFRTELGW